MTHYNFPAEIGIQWKSVCVCVIYQYIITYNIKRVGDGDGLRRTRGLSNNWWTDSWKLFIFFVCFRYCLPDNLLNFVLCMCMCVCVCVCVCVCGVCVCVCVCMYVDLQFHLPTVSSHSTQYWVFHTTVVGYTKRLQPNAYVTYYRV